jgi:hypothetical protein
MGIDHTWTVFIGADSILPMILIGKTAAWPTQDGEVELAQGFDDIGSDPTFVGDAGFSSDPEPVIDATPQVLGKVPIDMFAYSL